MNLYKKTYLWYLQGIDGHCPLSRHRKQGRGTFYIGSGKQHHTRVANGGFWDSDCNG